MGRGAGRGRAWRYLDMEKGVMETLVTIAAGAIGLSQVGVLTAIFFRLGRGQARIEELFRRVIQLEKRIVGNA